MTNELMCFLHDNRLSHFAQEAAATSPPAKRRRTEGDAIPEVIQ